MRLIGIDYGTKNVGLAISDEAAKFALPVSVLANKPGLVEEIKEIAGINGVKKIIIGESRNYKGQANAIMPDIERLKKELEGEGFEVVLEPEYMTSIQAERLQGKNDMIDASAAAIILQSYLDRPQG